MRTRVKICGITRPEDALHAVRYGADAIGLVFYPKSPRAVDVKKAQQICAVLPPFVCVVGLFVDAQPKEIETVLQTVPVTLLQFHGEESQEECSRYGRSYVKAITVRPEVRVEDIMTDYSDASGFLLDAFHPDLRGGSGQTFDWNLIPEASEDKFIVLAGGLTPDNVSEAIRTTRPYAVDVSSGVERSKGIKDHEKMKTFMQAVRSGDART